MARDVHAGWEQGGAAAAASPTSYPAACLPRYQALALVDAAMQQQKGSAAGARLQLAHCRVLQRGWVLPLAVAGHHAAGASRGSSSGRQAAARGAAWEGQPNRAWGPPRGPEGRQGLYTAQSPPHASPLPLVPQPARCIGFAPGLSSHLRYESRSKACRPEASVKRAGSAMRWPDIGSFRLTTWWLTRMPSSSVTKRWRQAGGTSQSVQAEGIGSLRADHLVADRGAIVVCSTGQAGKERRTDGQRWTRSGAGPLNTFRG